VSGDKAADFSIGENSGVLRVNRQLDFERKNAYQLTIQVTDGQGGMEKEYFYSEIQEPTPSKSLKSFSASVCFCKSACLHCS
jgi:hypothetical protein